MKYGRACRLCKEGRGGGQEQCPVGLQSSRIPDPTCTLLPALLVFYWPDIFYPEVGAGSNSVVI